MKLKIRNTEIYISFLFSLLLSFLIAFDASLTVLVCFISIILHELAHTLMLCILKAPIRKLEFQPFGIYIEHSEYMLCRRQRLLVASAGVIFNLLFAVILMVIYIAGKNQTFLKISMINFLLFLFNSLPVKNLDGGDMLKVFLELRLGFDKGSRVFKRVSLITSILMMIAGAVVFLKFNHNPSLLIISLTLLFYCFSDK